MQTITLHPLPGSRVIRPTLLRVYVDDAPRPDLHVIQWRQSLLPFEEQLTIAHHDPTLEIRPAELTTTKHLPPIDSVISIRPESSDTILYRGVVIAHQSELADKTARSIAITRNSLLLSLNFTPRGRWAATRQGAAWQNSEAIEFNTTPEFLMTANLVDVQATAIRVFDTNPIGRLWTLADAMVYLFHAHLPADVQTPSFEELRALIGDIPLSPIRWTDATLPEILFDLARRAGLEIGYDSAHQSLDVFRLGRDGATIHLGLQSTGDRWDTSQSNLTEISLHTSRRPNRPTVHLLGHAKQYEATFTLQRGWDVADETNWRAALRGDGAYTDAPDLYRTWVLNEHDRYTNEKAGVTAYSFRELDPNDFLLDRPRRFEACLSTDAKGNRFDCVVEYRPDNTAGWRVWPGPVWMSPSECTARLGGDALPSDYFQAVRNGTVAVRITASVQADRRLELYRPGDPGAPVLREEHESHAGYWAVHSSSRFLSASTTPRILRDDTSLLEQMAEALQRQTRQCLRIEARLPWIDVGCRPGDRAEQIRGQETPLQNDGGSTAFVRSVVHDLQTQQTTLHLQGGLR